MLFTQSGFALSHKSKVSPQILSKLPTAFERNRGQFDPDYPYIAQTPDTFFAFAKDHVNLVLNARSENQSNYLRMRFLISNSNPEMLGLDPKCRDVFASEIS